MTKGIEFKFHTNFEKVERLEKRATVHPDGG
jgi:hypothetical protein